MNATPAIMDFFNKWTLASTPGARTAYSAPSAPPLLCPAQNGKNHFAGGKDFKISCSADTPKTPAYTGATTPGNFRNCIAQCAADAQCGHAVYYNDKCWKKKGKPGSIAKAGSNARVAVKN